MASVEATLMGLSAEAMDVAENDGTLSGGKHSKELRDHLTPTLKLAFDHCTSLRADASPM
jgi:hypothetical protein